MPKKRGRPKGKPLSAKERAQRRAAPHKHGAYAETALAQAAPPCKESSCPTSFPCEVKTAIENRGGGVSVCIPALADQEAMLAFKRALEKGDLDGVRELAAMSLGLKASLERKELQALVDEGLTYDAPIFGVGPEGPILLGEKRIENPRAHLVLKLGEHLGHTATDQVLTPKAGAVAGANKGLEELGKAAWIGQMRRLASGSGADDEEAA